MKLNTMYAYHGNQVSRLDLTEIKYGAPRQYVWAGTGWPPVATVLGAMRQLTQHGWSIAIDPPMMHLPDIKIPSIGEVRLSTQEAAQ